jgi:hypothetical protein
MANREKGEVSLDIGGASYTLCLDINAMCRLEDMFSTPAREVTFQDILMRVQRNSITHIRAVLWAAFLKHHPEFTLDEVADVVRLSGGLDPFVQKIEALGIGATPDQKDIKTSGVNGTNPHKAQRARRGADGTGTVSIGTGGASV